MREFHSQNVVHNLFGASAETLDPCLTLPDFYADVLNNVAGNPDKDGQKDSVRKFTNLLNDGNSEGNVEWGVPIISEDFNLSGNKRKVEEIETPEEKERKKKEHNDNERKRRLKMNETFEELRELLPNASRNLHKGALLSQAVAHLRMLNGMCVKLHSESQKMKKINEEQAQEVLNLKSELALCYKGLAKAQSNE
eukprot:CAMPEP_0177649634 /NCGR_PEP_ID=MMETSP0447-20121125/11500_1 /TAXON_ID=0 /ORGANISM="Stygamoeba regulata, Strain BSH-02190019" /LENGTH=194 /DNA_ID=CAMNT_0019152423 /DNA_START=63 /DNA_END=647 /DNA_ORIENTATION=+